MYRRQILRLGGAALLAAGGALPAAPALAQDYTVGFSQATMNHPWRVAMVEGNKKYAQEHLPDVELIVTDGQNNAGKQVTDVETLLGSGIDVLMISPLAAQALTPVIKRAMADGTPVITLDRKVNTPVTVHIGAENKPIGADAGAFIAEKLGGQGSIVEIQGTAGASATVDRHDGFREAIAKHPGLKVVAEQYADYLREPALRFMEDTLQRFGPGEIKAVYAHNDEMALGAIQALEAAGRLGEVTVVGIDGQETAFQAVKDGKLAATFIYPYCAPEGIQYAYKVAKGEEVPSEVILKGQKVDTSNVDQFLGKGF
jgi:ribose transport system substrate-binding protein